MSNEKPNLWLELRTMALRLESSTDYALLDYRSQRLLEWIYVHASKKEPLFMQSIVMKSDVASPATIYKSLALLEQTGLITAKVDPQDTRRRIVKTTAKAEKLMEELGRQVQSWMKQV